MPVQFLSALHGTLLSFLYAHDPYGIAPNIAMFAILYMLTPFLLSKTCTGQSVTPVPGGSFTTSVGCIGIAADSSS